MNCNFCGKSDREVNKILTGNDDSQICNECVELCHEILEEGNYNHKHNRKHKIDTPQEILDKLNEHIVNQEYTKKVLSVAVYNHYKRINNPSLNIEKSNVLLIGSTGTGKTLFAKTIADFLNVPFVQADATSLTAAGYVGNDIEGILKQLIEAADDDIEQAEQGIIYIDEIDKIAKKSTSMSTARSIDVGGEAVQQGLLKLLEGTEVEVPKSNKINTKNILFICGGAFVGLSKESDKVRSHDLFKYGMIPELMGRLPVISELRDLTHKELTAILTQPKNAITKQYEKLFATDDVKLTFQPDALKSIVDECLIRKTGARGLRGVIEDKMLNIQFDIPSIKDKVKEVIITKEVILSDAYPTVIPKTIKHSAARKKKTTKKKTTKKKTTKKKVTKKAKAA